MSNERFRITTNPKSQSVAFDEKEKKHYIGIELEDLLNEQQTIIERLKKRINELESIVADDINSRYEIKEAWKERTRKRW